MARLEVGKKAGNRGERIPRWSCPVALGPRFIHVDAKGGRKSASGSPQGLRVSQVGTAITCRFGSDGSTIFVR